MPLCDPANWKIADEINNSIWSESPGRQVALAAQFPVGHVGAIGGQQAMFAEGGQPGGPLDPLPWVPDLVGKKSGRKDAVMIIGSAYAPFVTGFTRRARRMSLPDYNIGTWWEFLSGDAGFLQEVVGDGNGADEHNYYSKIATMFNMPGPAFDLERIILTDWCRASFVKRVAVAADGVIRPDHGGDGICTWRVFKEYLLGNCAWHKRRLGKFNGRIVLLGNLSHRCLQTACEAWGWIITYHNAGGAEVQPPPATIGAFWNDGQILRFGRIARRKNTPLEFVAVWHPSAHGWNVEWVEGLRDWVDI